MKKHPYRPRCSDCRPPEHGRDRCNDCGRRPDCGRCPPPPPRPSCHGGCDNFLQTYLLLTLIGECCRRPRSDK
ncbi:MAG: hypothetical protein ACI4MI_01695 [Christensenellales bacterium]